MKPNRALLLTILLSMLAIAPQLFAATNELVYSGYAANSNGEAIEGSYSVVVTLYDAVTAGTTLWTETQTVNFSSGFFTIKLGDDAANPLPEFGNDLYLGIAVDGGSEMTPRNEFFGSVRAREADVANSLAGVVLASPLTWTGAQTFGDATTTNLTVSGTATVTNLTVTGTCTGCGGAEGVEELVGTATANVRSTGTTLIYTVPASRVFLPRKAIFYFSAASTPTPTMSEFAGSIGTNAADYNDLSGFLALNAIDAVNKYVVVTLDLAARTTFLQAGEVIRLNETSAPASGTGTLTVKLYGIYIQ